MILEPTRHDNNTMNIPLVSVVIPAFNAERYIRKTLDSVIQQTYKNLEIIVVDDGSSDRTADIVSTYQKQDSRLLLLQQPNSGVAAARNTAIRFSNGEFVAPIDADDIWYPYHLEKQVRRLALSPAQVGLVYSWSVDIDITGKQTGGFRASQIEGNVFATLISHNFIGNASATMVRLSCFKKVGLYDTSLRKSDAQGCEDWDLYLRIAEAFEFRSVSAYTVGYRKYNESMSRDYEQMSRSHSLVMHAVRQRRPEINEWLLSLSASNLYFYFSRQCQEHNMNTTSLFWIRRAIRKSPIICWVHPHLYIAACLSLFSHREKQLTARNTVEYGVKDLGIRQYEGKAGLSVAVGNLYHWSVTRLNPQLASQERLARQI